MKRATVVTETAHTPWRDSVVWSAIFAAVVQVAVIWTPGLSLGVPGEWTWGRIPYGPGESAAVFLNLFIVIPAAIAYFWYCRAGTRHAERTSRTPWVWLAGLVACGFGWLWIVQESLPAEIHRLGRAPFVQFYPSLSGYFTKANETADLNTFLANYEGLMAEGDVLHIGTHPPGLIVGHWMLLQIYERSPLLTSLTLATRPASVRESESMLQMIQAQTSTPVSDAVLAELWAFSLLVQLAAAAAVIPLYSLVAASVGHVAAWRTSAFWPLVPALAIFLPKSDAIYPLIGMGVLALWHRTDPPSIRRSILAGSLFWLGTMLSLAILPVAVVAGLLTVQSVWRQERSARSRIIVQYLKATAIAAGAFGLLTGLVWLAFDLNLVNVWSWNYHNHAAFYDAYSRTYWKWLVVSPFELAVAVGLPITVTAVAALWQTRLASPTFAALAVILVLWISGKNSGEAARLWLFLMPWVLWMGAPLWSESRHGLRWNVTFFAQLIASCLTVVRISGFGFEEYMRSISA